MPSRRKPTSTQRRPLRKLAPATSLPDVPTWRLGTAVVIAPAVQVYESAGALHRLAVAGLPFHMAHELIGTVTDTSDAACTLIDTAAPGLHTLRPTGRLSAAESERLLHVGRLFVVLEAASGSAATARAQLATPIAGLGNRSPLDRSGSIAGLEHAGTLLVAWVRIEFSNDTGDEAP
ncbi:MAG: hypothetical protein HY084_07980 [Gemmatimonadetes bacterium]|nr:hypothetical protein [Gemmatimonadota bacterium]